MEKTEIQVKNNPQKRQVPNRQLIIRRICLMALDSLLVYMASVLALFTRFEFQLTLGMKEFYAVLLGHLPVFILITLAVFWIGKIYNSLWQYAGMREMINIVASCIMSGLLILLYVVLRQSYMPRSFYILYVMYLTFMTGATRMVYRTIRYQKAQILERFFYRNTDRLMVIGAGEAGRILIREIQNSQFLHQKVCCVIDDDPRKRGSYICGIRIAGNRYKIMEQVIRHQIDEIIIAMPSVKRNEQKEILDICQNTGCRMKIVPGLYQLMNGEVSYSKLRPVSIEDLLGREEIHINMDEIRSQIVGKVVLVTGGGGSIGSELCRQIAAYKPKNIIIVDIYENNIYDLQRELQSKFLDLNLVVQIGSIRDYERMDKLFERYRPDIVYHAAAHKHVPLMEGSPNEAIKNNVLGTWNLVMAADKWKVKKFVQISTDKAVNPTNIMGASKRICEMIIQTANKQSETDFVAVRFGNVLGSSGSVVPLFARQIAEGGPVTVTHPDIIRYFMTISEAVSLVLQAGCYAEGGEIFVLDMGEPVKIVDLAKNMIRLSGFVPDEDIRIVFTGLRPGEKLYEELLMDEEGMQATPNKLIYIGHPIDVDESRLMDMIKKLDEASKDEAADIRAMVKELVDTYQYGQIPGDVENDDR